jgi:hypothetical protein
MDFPDNQMQFEDEYEELAFLRDLAQRLWHGTQAGRTTAYDSFDLDYAWDMLEEYNFFYDKREADTHPLIRNLLA